MIYQLRFLSSVPLSAWLRTTSAILDGVIPERVWPLSLPAGDRAKKLKKSLVGGLLSFVTRRALCGTSILCETGCLPAPENKSPDRFACCVILGNTRQYLVESPLTLREMSQKLADSVLFGLPGAVFIYDKIETVLEDALSAHLFENTLCRQIHFCHHSKLMDLKSELQQDSAPESPSFAKE